MPTVFMFSGQGSQHFQMGRALYDGNATFARWMNRMDGQLRDMHAISVVEQLYGAASKAEPFCDITFTHPAIFMVEFALAQTLIEAGIQPDYTLGASLGSFAASSISGGLSMENALSLVVRQATTFKSNCPPGGMTAVLAEPSILADLPSLLRYSVAAVNFSSHFVLAAPLDELAGVERTLQQRSATLQRLPVSYAFHSPWIDGAKNQFLSGSGAPAGMTARTPLLCCASAKPLTELPSHFLWDAVREPIRFQDTVTAFEASGPHHYIDVGPAGTLATFVKYALPAGSRSKPAAIMSPFGDDKARMTQVLSAGACR